MELGQITTPRIPNTPINHTQQTNTSISSTLSTNSIFTMNNTYLMYLLCIIIKRLLKVAS